MKNMYVMIVSLLVLSPAWVSAATFDSKGGLAGGDPKGGAFGEFLSNATEFIFGPLLTFLLAIAFIAFAWGVLKYFIASAEDDKSAAKSLMLYGIGGFVLILVLFGLVNLLVSFLGLGGDNATLNNLPSLNTED